jgi:hypothetical protein
MDIRSPKSRIDRGQRHSERLLGDETHFLKTLLQNPRLTGAVAPSGPFLARAMARAVGTARHGLVVAGLRSGTRSRSRAASKSSSRVKGPSPNNAARLPLAAGASRAYA